MAKKAKKCPTGQHPICDASDSRLAWCVCWCAECKEIMAEVKANYKKQLQGAK